MSEIDHRARLDAIFASLDLGSGRLTSRESSSLEFKQTFNWGSRSAYGKSMAAFANNRGGYLIFGVTDAPRHLVGMTGTNFDTLDEAKVTAYLNSAFSPELQYEKFSWAVGDKTVGVIFTARIEVGPVVAIKNDWDIKEAEIYYRYNARNDKAKYPELRAMLDRARDRERREWMELFKRVGKIGPTNAGVMNLATGSIEGSGQSLLIDAKLLPKLRFIQEGTLAEKGKPVLKLVGDVKPITVAGYQVPESGLRLTNDPNAPTVREEDILAQFPLRYHDLRRRLRKDCPGFKEGKKFIALKRELETNPELAKERLLDPQRPRGGKKVFYSEAMITEFCKRYGD